MSISNFAMTSGISLLRSSQQAFGADNASGAQGASGASGASGATGATGATGGKSLEEAARERQQEIVRLFKTRLDSMANNGVKEIKNAIKNGIIKESGSKSSGFRYHSESGIGECHVKFCWSFNAENPSKSSITYSQNMDIPTLDEIKAGMLKDGYFNCAMFGGDFGSFDT